MDYSAMKSYLEKNDLQYFTFCINPEKPIMAVFRRLPPDTPSEGIPSSLENLGFSVIKERQITGNRSASSGQTHVETVPLFLVTLTRNTKSLLIFRLKAITILSSR
jgi:hypothetical protein